MAGATRDDYDGPFDPDFDLHDLSRATLAMLGREYMLGSHLQDRAGIPAVLRGRSMEEGWAVSIDEWMVASPAYSRRMQRLMRFEGTGMSTIFKNLQLDMGFPHQFMDVGFELHDETDGEFWLRSCGALADVRPMGHDMVKGMCHDVEDPTFDATAIATNARAQIRPLHRPPGVPKGGPDCHWTVRIRDEHPAVGQHPRLADMEATRLDAVVNDPPPSAEPGGWDDYSGPFDPHFELEDLSHRALVLVAREFALQGHELARGCMWAVEGRFGQDEAVRVGSAVFTGGGWVESERLAGVLGVDPNGGAVSIAKVLQAHRMLVLGDYLGVSVSMPDDGSVRVALADDAPALDEGDPYSVSGLLDLGRSEILESMVRGVDARASVTNVGVDAGERRAWRIVVDRDRPAPEPPEVQVVRVSTGPAQVFIRRRPIRR